MKLAKYLNRLFGKGLLATAMTSLLLVSCGDPAATTSAGIGGTGIVYGVITDFGSVYVNGVKFDTTGSTFDVDGTSYPDQDAAITAGLAKGMVVLINGNIDASKLAGSASAVIYDDEIQGPVASWTTVGAKKHIVIFGQTVIIDATSTGFKGTSFDTIAENDIVEVSGFPVTVGSSTQIVATFVKKTDVWATGSKSTVELKGIIENPMPASFTLNGINIYFDDSTELNLHGSTLVKGLFVEVKGTLPSITEINATEIEKKSSGFGSNISEISLQGIISKFTRLSNFSINGQQIDASAASLSPDEAALFKDGANVEVEGSIVAGVLIAEELELREGSLKMRAAVAGVYPATNSFTLTYDGATLAITTDAQTRFEDDLSSLEIKLTDLNPDDFVRVEAVDNSGVLLASTIKRRSPDDTSLRGPVESFGASSFTILGINFNVQDATVYEKDDLFVSAKEFHTWLTSNPDAIIEIVDQGTDGLADKVTEEN